MKMLLPLLLPGLLTLVARATEPDDHLPPAPPGKALKLTVVVASAVCTAQCDETSAGIEAKTLAVAVVSSHSEFCDVEANLKHFESLIKEAKGLGARLVCFPELALMAYSTEKEILDVAEEIPGPSTARLEAIARSHDVYLSVGMAEKAGEGYPDMPMGGWEWRGSRLGVVGDKASQWRSRPVTDSLDLR